MKLANKFKKGLVIAMAMSTAITTVYATPVGVMGISTEVAGAPVFFGLEDATVRTATQFNPMEGVTAFDADGNDLTARITVEGNVQTSKEGTYELTYKVIDNNGLETVKVRKVIVGIPPAFGNADDVTLRLGTHFNPLQGVLAIDRNGKNISDRIETEGYIQTSIAGVYTMTYKVTDDFGATATHTRIITVIDPNAPQNNEATFTGVENTVIYVGDAFDPMAGVKAIDPMEGDITASVKALNYVQPNKPGAYLVIYVSQNSKGFQTTVYRMVEVKEAEVNLNPVILGLDDIVVNTYGKFSMLEGVSAFDANGNDLMKTLRVWGDFNTRTPGTRILNYQVTDSEGRVTVVERKVIVVE